MKHKRLPKGKETVRKITQQVPFPMENLPDGKAGAKERLKNKSA